MDENRLHAYLTVIQALLSCPSGEEGQILNANSDLIDSGLVTAMEQVARVLEERGDRNNANWLQSLADQLAQKTSNSSAAAMHQTYVDFYVEVLQATWYVESNPQGVYALLEANLDKLDDNFAQVLQSLALARLSEVGSVEAHDISVLIGNFSDLMRDFRLGSRARNLEIAIAGYEVVVTVFTRANFPQNWAMTQNSLGNAYFNRIRGERAENLEVAIRCFLAALEIRTHADFPQNWAMTQHNLGNVYSNRIQGERAENLEAAIHCCSSALEVHTRAAFPEQWATTQMTLGNVYRERIRGEKAENLETAIHCCSSALEVHTRAAFPEKWADAQIHLGNAYHERIRGEKAENLEAAIRCYSTALEVRTRQAFPEKWSDIQNNLGNVYRERIRGEKAENLEAAIHCYSSALEVCTRAAFPEKWADTQMNLGNAYNERIRGEKAENLEAAIHCYSSALEVCTRAAFPEKWADTQMNLGNAYNERIRGEKAENLEMAIRCYEAVFEVFTHKTFPEKWATTQSNLGNTYSDRIEGERAENLEVAIRCQEAALEVFTRQAFPEQWAGTQINMGKAYCYRIEGERAKNLETAIYCYSSALEVYTHTAFPEKWAITQNSLGNAYCERVRGDRAENLEAAIRCFLVVLEVRTREAFPHKYVGIQDSLGFAYQKAQQFRNAYTAFGTAIDTAEFLRGEIAFGSGREEDKQKLADEYNQIYRGMVEVCLELHDYAQAVEYVERSKARSLVELLATRELYPKGEIPEAVRNELQRLRQEIDVEKRRLSADATPNYTYLNQLRQWYNELYPYEPIRFDQIQNLIDDQTAIIEWYFFDDCFRAFIITRHSSQPLIWTSSAEDRENWHNWRNEELMAYYAPREAETEAERKKLERQWEIGMAARLQQLAEILHINDILDILSQIPATFDQLVLVPHLYLHLLPLHALPISGKNCLLDLFPRGIRYTPSCELLQRLQQQQRPQFQRLFGIQNPTPDLYEKYEHDLGAVGAIKKQFADSYILKQDKAKKSAILRFDEKTKTVIQHEELSNAQSVFFFCHGYFLLFSSLDSGLQLADENLTLGDIIAHLNLKNCRLVTLSACETGLTDFRNMSDEYISLPYGFLLAGSTNVVSSLWQVNATATALLMTKFYEELKHQRGNIVVALNTAQRWLRDTTVKGFRDWLRRSQLSVDWQDELDEYFEQIEVKEGATTKPFESPYYWAAFCAIGKGV